MPDNTPRIILLGDSLTQGGFQPDTKGYGWALQRYYSTRAVVVNKGINGITTESIRHHFNSILTDITAPNAPPTKLFSIFLGANDGCLHPWGVPLPEFAANMTAFVEKLTTHPALTGLKVVLIATPPINVRDADRDTSLGSVETAKKRAGWRNYVSKKTYAEKVMEIAQGFENRGVEVVGVDLWGALVDAALVDQGRGDEEGGRGDRRGKYEEERLPGCGLPDSREFPDGYFCDALHFEWKAYEVLTKVFQETVFAKWPELQADRI
ncbi:SGNH hydrolase [Pseudovirgaria hyperparasitica]|uniref:SGNH hydrolase n=1 Tax=Pseudovirgaria hyperparasitica TaxID=470096 RepID=A0A6A6WCU8_9PEZI|nr:SGNH hydrolase [Pseudovirgaria hyperparasitica]KAF2758931.1 SGNH hydrolase [Pseudovirgaria hyperparasitica]